MDIDMRELEAFACVVEQGSFSKAAKVLFLTQPTVSSHVADLEKKLQIQLLVRTSRVVYPSDAGQLLYRYARKILDLRTQAVEAVEAFSREMRGTIRVAASPTPGRYYLPGLLQAFQARYPDIRFDVELLSSKAAAARVAGRQAELGFTGTVVSLPACLYQTLAEDRFVIAAPDTPFYRSCLSAGLSPRQLTRETWISREAGSHSRMEMEHYIRALGLHLRDLRIAAEVRSTPEMLQLVHDGAGIAIVPRIALRYFTRTQPLLSFSFDAVQLRQKIYLVRRRNHVLSPIAQTFCRFAAEEYQPADGADTI